MVKLDENGQIDNKKNITENNYQNIDSYAVNGAVYYANAILHYTSYTDIIAIGITGYENENKKLIPLIVVYFVSKDNFGLDQKIGEYSDLSFLKKEYFDNFITTM